MALRKIVCKTHGKLFGIKEEKVSIVSYGYLGIYKVLILVFNIVSFLIVMALYYKKGFVA